MLRTRHVSGRCTLLLLAASLALTDTTRAQTPAGEAPATTVQPDATPFAERREHWAWHPLRVVEPPPTGTHPVDAFVGARLATAGLEPSPPAAPHEQLRRLWLDLCGLPPPADAVQRFAAGDGEVDDATYRLEVDLLLASPHFGERWARHWLDLVRYAETLGHEYDFEVPNAWRYRDYVIRARNDDVPYDQFVREHLAGDLLPEPRRDAAGNDESVQATAAWWFVEQTHSPVDALQHQADRIDNQIDVLGKAFLGLTVACARCHDHKFDAITTRDYYSLFGFVQSSRYVQAPIHPIEPRSGPFQAAVVAQHAAAEACVAADGDVDGGGLQAWLRATPPADWAAASGIALRPEDQSVASCDDHDGRWFVTNDGFGAEPFRGPFCLDPEESRPEWRLLPGAWWLSAVAGRKREGTVATATFALEQRYLHVRVAGQGSRVKLIVDGLHVVRDPIYGDLHQKVENADAHWLTFDVAAWQGHSAFLQAIDQRAPDLGDPQHDRGQYPDDAWLALQAVILSPHASPPPATTPTTTFAWSERPAELQRLAELQLALPVSPTLPALADGTGRDGYVFRRGNHRHHGEPAPRRFLSTLAGDDPLVSSPHTSGRLQLAEALLAPDNPLPARALVNRIWHHLFGRGLVASADNLGALGDAPSHPQLLDWLARDCIAHGWSIKHTIRTIVCSATYRQSSRREGGPNRSAAEQVDADNVLLHRQNVRPLEAEIVRDALLAVSGRLDRTMYGPSIEQPEEAITKARGRPRNFAPRDGHGRRSIYLAMRRNFMPTMMLAFDLPTPFAPVACRNTSNVPAQALALANDPFVHDMCRLFAQRVCDASQDATARLHAAYRLAFARPPRADEEAECMAFLTRSPGDDATAWTDLVHALVNTTEFRFQR